MREDNLEGARDLLAARLDELWQAAGTPPLDTVARNAQSGRLPSSARLTGKKISAWKTGANVPSAFRDLECVIRLLIGKARFIEPQNTTLGLYDEKQWARWWKEARQSSPRISASSQTRPVGQLINESLDPFNLEVHRAISGQSNEFTPILPAYIERVHDLRVRELVDWSRNRSMLVVLVGGSSTGKTRTCWEAVQRLEGWRLWHPLSPGRPEALLAALDQRSILPRTVLWLNEMQHYLDTPGSSIGEKVAAGLRDLLREADLKPILVLGTLWPEYWDALTRRPMVDEYDTHAQTRELLVGHEIIIPESFDDVDLAGLSVLSGADERIMQAINRPDKRVTQFLAGAFELLSRYEAAPASARALIDVAIDARRFGYIESIPEWLLADAAQGYMNDYVWNELSDEWFAAAIKYARQACLGVSGPLVQLRPRSANVLPSEPFYRLADFLEENGRRTRRYTMPPESFWDVIVKYYSDSPGVLIDLAYEVHYRGRYRYAAQIYLTAAAAGEIDGLLFLADSRKLVGDNSGAEKVYKMAMDRGSLLACVELARLQEVGGDKEAAKRILKDSLDHHSLDLANRDLAWNDLVLLCKETDDVTSVRHWLEQAAQKGDNPASVELARLDGVNIFPENETLSRLQKAAQHLLSSHRELEELYSNLIEQSLAGGESYAWALQFIQEKVTEEEKEGRHVGDLVLLGRFHGAHGNAEAAKSFLLKAANFLNEDAYIEGKIPAVVELVNVLERSGDTQKAEQLWMYGLELDGTIAEPWDVLDQVRGE